MTFVLGDLGTIADWASLIGFVLSIVGFIVTIISVVRAKKSADLAAAAARRAEDAILRRNTVAELAAVITMIEEVKRLHRLDAWAILPDRYATIQRLVISIREANPAFPDPFKSTLQSAIKHLGDAEKQVEKSNAGGTKPPRTKMLLLNEVLSDLLNRLAEIQAAILKESRN